MTTRIFPVLSGIVPDEKPFTSFLSCLSFSNNWGSLLLISGKILSQGFLSSTFGILDEPPCYVWQCYV